MKENILEMKDVWKVYLLGRVEVPAIRGINLSVRDGEYISITGPSGSGKSTLLNIIGCLDSPTSGSIYLRGVDISVLSENELATIRRRTIGFVFQTFNLIPGLTAEENVALPMRFDGVSKREAMGRAVELLNLVGIGERAKHKPLEMSGGERQRVAIARALINNPKMVLADEPTGNLDSKSGRKVIEVLEDLYNKGITLILITHDEKLAMRAERELHIEDGRFVSERENKKGKENKKGEKIGY